jgi:hypothetical protein
MGAERHGQVQGASGSECLCVFKGGSGEDDTKGAFCPPPGVLLTMLTVGGLQVSEGDGELTDGRGPGEAVPSGCGYGPTPVWGRRAIHAVLWFTSTWPGNGQLRGTDLSSAYAVDDLRRLEQSVVCSREGTGAIAVTDTVWPHFAGEKYASRRRPRICFPRSLAWTRSRLKEPMAHCEARI